MHMQHAPGSAQLNQGQASVLVSYPVWTAAGEIWCQQRPLPAGGNAKSCHPKVARDVRKLARQRVGWQSQQRERGGVASLSQRERERGNRLRRCLGEKSQTSLLCWLGRQRCSGHLASDPTRYSCRELLRAPLLGPVQSTQGLSNTNPTRAAAPRTRARHVQSCTVAPRAEAFDI